LREQRLIGHPVPARAPGPEHGKRGARPPRPRRWTEAELLRQRGLCAMACSDCLPGEACISGSSAACPSGLACVPGCG
jgi:hypothetical protein